MRGGGKDYRSPAPVIGLKDVKITKVACGDFHSVALTTEGKLYSWGGGGNFFNRGQCGHGNNKDSESPEIIRSLEKKIIVNLVCGGYHTLALSSDNELYAWGSGLYGECGFGAFVHSHTPKMVIFSGKPALPEVIHNLIHYSRVRMLVKYNPKALPVSPQKHRKSRILQQEDTIRWY